MAKTFIYSFLTVLPRAVFSPSVKAMDAAVSTVVDDSRAEGAAGVLAVDSSGLCLAAAGKLPESAGGRLALVASAARRVQPDAPRPPVLVLETESSTCLVTSAGAVTTALLRDKA